MVRQLTPTQSTEILDARANPLPTLRPTSPGAEAALHTPVMLLDHGMVRFIDYMGTDASIPQAARVSYGKGTKGISDDEALIRYLMRHLHSTPFEMVTAKFHVVCPIFVARQWLRHRSGSFNEYSARYSILEREFYVPEPEHLAAQSSTNKQGRGNVLEGENARRVLNMLKNDATQAYDHYEWMVDEEECGLARELARINLPVSVYTQFYWSVNLWNLFHFTKLRADGHAQYEIRVYAQAILDHFLMPWVPLAANAFNDYRLGATQLSRQATGLIAAALEGRPLDGLERPGKREMAELVAAFPGMARFLE